MIELGSLGLALGEGILDLLDLGQIKDGFIESVGNVFLGNGIVEVIEFFNIEGCILVDRCRLLCGRLRRRPDGLGDWCAGLLLGETGTFDIIPDHRNEGIEGIGEGCLVVSKR